MKLNKIKFQCAFITSCSNFCLMGSNSSLSRVQRDYSKLLWWKCVCMSFPFLLCIISLYSTLVNLTRYQYKRSLHIKQNNFITNQAIDFLDWSINQQNTNSEVINFKVGLRFVFGCGNHVLKTTAVICQQTCDSVLQQYRKTNFCLPHNLGSSCEVVSHTLYFVTTSVGKHTQTKSHFEPFCLYII